MAVVVVLVVVLLGSSHTGGVPDEATIKPLPPGLDLTAERSDSEGGAHISSCYRSVTARRTDPGVTAESVIDHYRGLGFPLAENGLDADQGLPRTWHAVNESEIEMLVDLTGFDTDGVAIITVSQASSF